MPATAYPLENSVTAAISTQGTTGGASTITITCLDHGQVPTYPVGVRVSVWNTGTATASTNATIAAGGSELSFVHTATKDVTFVAATGGVITVDLTDATAETVDLRFGPGMVNSFVFPVVDLLQVTHAA